MNHSIWACPLCQAPLALSDSSAKCSANHRFDQARQGYLPLLPAHHKRSQAPGDDRQMLTQRREFLHAGYYRPLAEQLCQLWSQRLSSEDGQTLLDSGCGEGYYLSQLQQVSADRGEGHSGDAALYGIDISKEATKLAARVLPPARVAVASGFQLPVLDRSVDVLLRVFSPGDAGEVSRVLKPTGEFWRVVPGAEHLLELKRALYSQVKPHQLPDTPAGFRLKAAESVQFRLELQGQAIAQLLQMTPFVWRARPEARQALELQQQLSLQVDFVIQQYQLAHPERTD